MMGFFDNVKKAFGSKEDVESQNNVNDEIIDKPTPNDKIRNFKYLDDLIHSGVKEIVLDSDIILSNDEESEYEDGIRIDVDNLIIEGNGHSIDAKNKTRIFKIYSKVTIKNLTLKNGLAIDGGAINIQKGDVDMSGCQFKDNTANNHGGAILNWGKLSLAKTMFKGNSTQEKSGGAINIQKGDVDISGCQFQENTAKDSGGAILNWGKLSLTETMFKGNSTQEKSGGAIKIREGDVDMSGCQFQDNAANSDGGAIFADKDGYVDINGCQFQDNIANKHGGAILNRGKLALFETMFKGNSTQGETGGAINIQPGGYVDMSGCQFQDNTANKHGGAILNFGKLLLAETMFKGNSTQGETGGAINNQDSGYVGMSGCQFQDNTAKDSGGAILNWGKLSVTESMFMRNSSKESSGGAISNSGSDDMEITDCQFLKNTAKEHAGAIGNFGKSSITGTLFKENSTRNRNGGAISNQPQGDMNITDCQFEKNTARSYGGAIENFGKLSIMRTLFNKNLATGEGGALYNDSGSYLRIDNCDFKSNNATGAHCIYNGSDNVKIIDSIFSHHNGSDKPISNKVLSTLFSSFPNSLIFNKDNMDIIGCTFEYNENYDNVIFSEKESRLTISGGKINNNHVKNTAIFTEAIECNISSTTFKNNILLSSDNQRGVDIINEAKLSIQALKIANDNAILNKGHIDVRRLSHDERKRIIYNVDDASIDEFNPPSEDKFDFTQLNNIIQNGSDEETIILNADICLENYELDFYEGGIDLDNDNLTIDGQNHFIDGKHKTRIFNITGKNITLKNIIFKNGSKMNIYGEHIGGGGAIKIAKNSNLTLENCKFIDNISQDDGGAILNNGTLQSKNNKFISNSSEYNGGAIHNNNNMHTTNDSFENNSSKIAGAIYNQHILTIKKDIILKNNRSDIKEDIYNANNIKTENIDLNTAKIIFNTHNINIDENTNEWQTFQYLKAKLKDSHVILDKNIKMEFKDIDDDLILMDNIEFDGNDRIIDLNYRNINFIIKNNVIIKHLTLKNALISKDSFFKIEGNLQLENVKFLNNKINTNCYLLNNQGNVEVIDSHFYNNYIKNNSLINNTHNLEITNTTFINNHSNSYGTVINTASDKKQKVLVQNSLFKYNSTTKSGGTIIIDDYSVFEISKSKFIKNTAKQNGGAIINWGNLSITETLFKGNSTRKGDGGAININKKFSNANITNCRFQENSVISNGGAIWYYSKKNLNLKDCTFKDNEPDDVYRYSIR